MRLAGVTYLRNDTNHQLDVWINGGGPVARVPPKTAKQLKLNHVDPSTTRGGCQWSTTASIVRLGQPHSFKIASGTLPNSSFTGSTTITVDGTYEIDSIMLIIAVQNRYRELRRARERAQAAQRFAAASKIQSCGRGHIARRPSRCLICMSEMPFAWMTSTVPNAQCHRTCRACAEEYVNHAIDEGKLYIRCPGESCTHLMSVDAFASQPAKAKHRENLRASHRSRLANESDTAFIGFCREHARMCPTCGVLIWRYAGCDHMSCRCGAQFNWRDQEARVSSEAFAAPEQLSMHLAAFRKLPGNQQCFDCGMRDPQWTSTTLGTVFCIECAGEHRKLGVARSRVRSLTLDHFAHSEAVLLRKAGGNAALQSFLEERGDSWAGLSITQRYTSDTADAYRRRLSAMHAEVSADLERAGERASEAGRETARHELASDARVEWMLMQRAPDGDRAREALNRTSAPWANASTDRDATLARRLAGLERLMMMGFEPGVAQTAFDRHGGDITRAALELVRA